MKFYNYISEKNEEENIMELIDNIKKDCKHYLKGLKKNNIPMPFGRNMEVYAYIGKKTVRKNRIPKGTDRETFVEINKGLEKNEFATRDKSVIGSSYDRKYFGDRFFIFPISNFDYTYILDVDFNHIVDNLYLDIHQRQKMDNFLLGMLHRIDKELDQAFKQVIKKENPKLAYDKGYEIWFECDKYYYISAEYKNYVEENLME